VNSTFHTPVLVQEVLLFLAVQKDKTYIDATIGGGGHGFEILKRDGIVLGIDVDEEAIDYVKKILRDKDIKILGEKYDSSLNISLSQYPGITLVRGNFKDIARIVQGTEFERVEGILFDLGVSSMQLDTSKRGFSFQKEAPLDMRMDQRLHVKAMDLLNGLTKKELYELFTKFGEERFAHAISGGIVSTRGIKKITTTKELAMLVEKIAGRRHDIHPVTKVFQALRIAVNDELHNLELGLTDSVELLNKNGKLVVISFHSLEDRIVKRTFLRFEKEGRGTVITKKPVRPSQKEVFLNRRARSALLRVFAKA